VNQIQLMWIYKSDSLHNLGLENHLISSWERGKEITETWEKKKKSKEKECESLKNKSKEGY